MVSIIIPVLNEANTIGKLLEHLEKNSTQKNCTEIILVDGGSTDATLQHIKNHIKKSTYPIYLYHAAKGRAKQMNMGASKATGAILYFLHADSYPPKNFDTLLINEVTKANLAGCFKMKFDSTHWWLQLASWLTHFHWRACRGGDQSQFITRALFDEIGGYDEKYIIYEDNILINELYKKNEFVVIQKWITTSARRYHKRGIWTLQFHFWMIYIKKWLGSDPDTLYKYYCKNIQTTS